ncbi:MAG: flagellar biosynthetic protein FliO [Alphaproteobacteria bacterium]
MELSGYIKFMVALAFVLGLILLLSYAIRRFGIGGLPVIARPRDGARRLAIVEVTAIDAKRRLVLVRRDNTEHLILLGANSELLIENSIPERPSQAGPRAES